MLRYVHVQHMWLVWNEEPQFPKKKITQWFHKNTNTWEFQKKFAGLGLRFTVIADIRGKGMGGNPRMKPHRCKSRSRKFPWEIPTCQTPDFSSKSSRLIWVLCYAATSFCSCLIPSRARSYGSLAPMAAENPQAWKDRNTETVLWGFELLKSNDKHQNLRIGTHKHITFSWMKLVSSNQSSRDGRRANFYMAK